MGSNIQQPGKMTFVIECDPDWTPCEKAQVRAKVKELNTKTPIARSPTYGPAVRAQGDACAAAWRREFNARAAGRDTPQSALLGDDPGNHPSGGNDADFADPCMKDEMNELEPAAKRDYVSSCQPDHTLELQFGGSPQGPMAFMSGRVNGSLGSQLSSAGNRTDGTTGPVDNFEFDGC